MASLVESAAPGWPGIAPRWTSSAKEGVGTSATYQSRVWFTISHGILNEVYYPRIDQANTRDMELLVADGDQYFSEQKNLAPRTRRTRIQARQLLQERTLQDDQDCYHRSRARRATAEGPLRHWQGQTGRLRRLCPPRSTYWKPWIRKQRMDRRLQGHPDALRTERRSLSSSGLFDSIQEDELRICRR